MSLTEERPSKSRLSSAERYRQIITAAATLFAERGYTGLTVKELSESCGMNQALLYRHFKSKHDLFVAVLEDKIRHIDIRGFLADLEQDLALEALLKALALHILAVGDRDKEIHRLLLFGSLLDSPRARKLFKAWRQPFVDYLQTELTKRIASGEIREMDPHITARSFIGMVMDCSVSCFLWPEFGYEEFNPQKAVANNVGIFVKGLMP